MITPVMVSAEPWSDALLQSQAQQAAEELHLRCMPLPELPDSQDPQATPRAVWLVRTPARWELRCPGEGYGPVALDWAGIDTHSPAGRSLKQPLARAAGLGSGRKVSSTASNSGQRLRVLDLTAGLGEDAWLLASLGCQVLAAERVPVLAWLLQREQQRMQQIEPEVAQRIHILAGDALALLRDTRLPPADVVYLDPMFPPKPKAALPRKEMRLLRLLAGEDSDAAALFEAARAQAVGRVVVKRPGHAPAMASDRLAVHEGKSFRFEVYGPRTG